MADEKNIPHSTDSIKRKRSRYWNFEETKKLVLLNGADIIYKNVWSPVQGLFIVSDDNKTLKSFVKWETGDKKNTLLWRIYLYEMKLNPFWTVPSSPWPSLNLFSKIIVTRRDYGRLSLNTSWLYAWYFLWI